ncbi:MAG: UDP-N-acetylmuramate dehydrogenase [Helicobacter sp.]|uniref:UDP-N-acetylmuramate dehydrogenase n=1 Tax=Helicobacter sp. TaxID=218 RepID=UPI0023D3E1F9|nr:UDP-N-acetylmuramate dehydrogenase [Helicobacter sp.]MDE5925684.1 UDP-N-acetylmuramate dehydrogenase [Helicobacter sp.]MDE7174928.1 UDP-N-acetylmuramate dehydrogenase [Helicobacter sp.]
MFQKIVDFSRYTSVRIGTQLALNYIESPQDYIALLEQASPQIIGKANNLLIAPNAKNLCALSKAFDYIKDLGDSLEVGSATPSGRLFAYAKRKNLRGFEILCGLPGSVGGIIKMNAGLKSYEIQEVLLGILQLENTAKLGFKNVESLGLSYRSSEISGLIFAGIFKKQSGFRGDLVEECIKMRQNQPKEPSFGSCFKNPKGDFAGRLIEAVGLKGVRFGKSKSLCFSEKHANFLVNLGDSTFEEALELIEIAKEKVQKECGIALENEVQILR